MPGDRLPLAQHSTTLPCQPIVGDPRESSTQLDNSCKLAATVQTDLCDRRPLGQPLYKLCHPI